MALAVFGVVVLPWVTDSQGQRDVTAGSNGEGDPTARQPELPDVVVLHCGPGSIDVPVASIRPQLDGLHIDVVNDLNRELRVWVTADDGWSSGRFPVRPGRSSVVVTPAPGALQLGCDAGGDLQRQIDLVDADHLYSEAGLDCDVAQQATLKDPIPVPGEIQILSSAARAARGEEKMGNDYIAPYSGYREAPYKAFTADPAVRLMRDGDTIAILHLTGTPTADPQDVPNPTPGGPWLSINRVDYCPEYLLPADTADNSDSRTPS